MNNNFIHIEDFWGWEDNFILPKDFNNTIYITKTKKQTDLKSWISDLENDLDLLSGMNIWWN